MRHEAPIAGRRSLGTLRAAFERTGTPAWVMRVIRNQGLDLAEGFRLELDLTGDGYRGHRQATAEALLRGDVDLIDTDWLSVGRLREEGAEIAAFHPYGRIMGGLVLDATRFPSAQPAGCIRAAHSPLDLQSIAGRSIAVVNRLDKTWLLLRASAVRAGLTDLAETVELVETGSKAEALRLLRDGRVDGAVLFWHLAAVACADPRFQLAFDAPDAVEAMTGQLLPTTFFIAAEDRLRARPELYRAFSRAFDQAVSAMRAHEPLWRHGAGDWAADGLATSLRSAWLRRVGLAWPASLGPSLDDLAAILERALGRQALGIETNAKRALARDFFTCSEVAA